jgi:NADH-quinone oxidoreductase subunit C
MEEILVNTALKNELSSAWDRDFDQVTEPDGILTITVLPESLPGFVQLLKDQFNFSFLTDLCGIHFPDQARQLGVIYHLHDLKKNKRIRVKTFVSVQNPVIPSIVPIFSAANWMERETFDFYGIIFDGHPNLTRILNVDYLDYFPMRKEYPLEDPSREDKEDHFFGR